MQESLATEAILYFNFQLLSQLSQIFLIKNFTSARDHCRHDNSMGPEGVRSTWCGSCFSTMSCQNSHLKWSEDYCAWRSWCSGARGPGYSWSRIPASRCHEAPGICGFCDWFSHFHHAIFMIFYQLYLHKIIVSNVIVESRIRSNLFVFKGTFFYEFQ